MSKTLTINKLDGGKVEVVPNEGESMKSILERTGHLNADSYSYMLSGKNVEGGQKQVDEATLGDVRVEADEQILIIPKVIAG